MCLLHGLQEGGQQKLETLQVSFWGSFYGLVWDSTALYVPSRLGPQGCTNVPHIKQGRCLLVLEALQEGILTVFLVSEQSQQSL